MTPPPAVRRPAHLIARTAAALVVAVGLIVASLPGAPRAVAQAPGVSTITMSATASAKKTSGKSMKALIKKAKKKNSKAFKKRLASLKKSPALVKLVRQANSRRYSLYMEYFAAITSAKKIAKLVKKTKGKHFVVTGKQSRPRVLLVSNASPAAAIVGATVVPTEITCWQGWVAFWAWWVGAEMTCVGFGAAVGAGMSPTGPMAVGGGLIAASACNGLMAYLQQQFIDFEAACRNIPNLKSVNASRWGALARAGRVT